MTTIYEFRPNIMESVLCRGGWTPPDGFRLLVGGGGMGSTHYSPAADAETITGAEQPVSIAHPAPSIACAAFADGTIHVHVATDLSVRPQIELESRKGGGSAPRDLKCASTGTTWIHGPKGPRGNNQRVWWWGGSLVGWS